MRVAAISFPVGGPGVRSWSQFATKLRRWVGRAADRGAELVVLPELAILDLCTGTPLSTSPELPPFLASSAQDYVDLIRNLASVHRLTLVGGSHIEQIGQGYRNVCVTATADGEVRRSEKQILTQWEAAEWGLEPGVSSLETQVASLICYDVEFPELVRPLVMGGLHLLCVPSYTETRHGFQRVRWSALARALENQIFVIHATLVGSLGGEPVPSTYGSSAILTPSVPPFPHSAILAETPLNRAGIAIADLDFELLAASRESGDVRNWNDYVAYFHNRI